MTPLQELIEVGLEVKLKSKGRGTTSDKGVRRSPTLHDAPLCYKHPPHEHDEWKMAQP